MSLNYRKHFAKRYLIALGRNPLLNIYTRAFDNCFEMGDGDEVVEYLIEQSKTNKLLEQGIKYMGVWEQWKQVAQENRNKQPAQ